MRQPRVKKESNHLSPDSEAPSPHIVSSPIYVTTPTLSLPQTSKSLDETRISPLPPQSILVNQPSLLTVTTTTNLLTVPQPSYLMKQHSHPLLSSQQQSGSGNYWIHRQHSNPEFPRRTTSPSIVVEPAPVIKTEEDILEDPIATTTTTTSTTDSTTTAGSMSGLRVKTTELRRSSSSPQVRDPKEFKFQGIRLRKCKNNRSNCSHSSRIICLNQLTLFKLNLVADNEQGIAREYG